MTVVQVGGCFVWMQAVSADTRATSGLIIQSADMHLVRHTEHDVSGCLPLIVTSFDDQFLILQTKL